MKSAKYLNKLTVQEICSIYNISPTWVCKKLQKANYPKEKKDKQYYYLVKDDDVLEIFGIPKEAKEVIYVHTTWHIYPSKMNFNTNM